MDREGAVRTPRAMRVKTPRQPNACSPPREDYNGNDTGDDVVQLNAKVTDIGIESQGG